MEPPTRSNTGAPAHRDEVDKVVAAWRRERPDLDVTPLHVLSRVGRISRHLDRARRHALSHTGLEAWGFDVLTALRRAGEPYQLTPRELITQTLVTSGTMTNRIDRLEQSGDVRRLPDPNDRRGTLVELTDAGRERVDSTMTMLLDSEDDFLSCLDDAEQSHLERLLRKVLLQFEE